MNINQKKEKENSIWMQPYIKSALVLVLVTIVYFMFSSDDIEPVETSLAVINKGNIYSNSEEEINNFSTKDANAESFINVNTKVESKESSFFISKKSNKQDYAIKSIAENMVYVEGGTFTMGADKTIYSDYDETPKHLVTLNGFKISKYEVTQSQWKALMKSTPGYFPICDNCPVGAVSWIEVQEFILKLNKYTGKRYRLPTEAEWEFAAKGGNKSEGYRYAGGNAMIYIAWFANNSDDKPREVGKLKPNELGLYDMTGNFHEWCSDWYHENYYSSSPTINPNGPSSGIERVIRGGSIYDYGNFSSVTHRSGTEPLGNYHHVGFRLASD